MLLKWSVPASSIPGEIIMSLHSGSSALAHNLDRFDFRADFELVAASAARLNVETQIVRMYCDWYGKQSILVTIYGQEVRIPAFEAHIRWQILGHPIRF
jgi:hypothetical protein